MIKRLDKIVPKLLERYKIPGVAIAFISNSKIASIKIYGFANIEKKIPITEKTWFQVASISKAVSAWGIMKLVEKKKIDLEAPIEKYLTRWHLPPSEFNHDKVTIKRVLNHSAGLSLSGYQGHQPKYDLLSIEESLNGKIPGPKDEYQLKYSETWKIDPHKEEKPVRVILKPGKEFLYSGGGYSILQLIIEEVTGTSFSKFMEIEILKPLGMESSSFEYRDLSLFATPYDEELDPLPHYKFEAKAAGGLNSTVEDLAKFGIASMEGPNGELPGRNVLNPQSIELMYTGIIDAGDDFGYQWKYGLGHFVTEIDGLKIVQHSGGHIGWRSMLVIIPQLKEGIVILINSSAGNPLWANILTRWSRVIFKK
ncbi:MAG: serine hydrolase domain-containing protein [Promethearchaeota archaeon]